MNLLRDVWRAVVDIGLALLLLAGIVALGTCAVLGAVLMGESFSR